MPKHQTAIIVKAFGIDNNPKTGLMDWQLSDGVNTSNFAMSPLGVIDVLNMSLYRLMQRKNEEIIKALQTLAIQDIEALVVDDGRPFLAYTLENGLGFASALEREKLEKLYQQLGEVLKALPPASDGTKVH